MSTDLSFLSGVIESLYNSKDDGLSSICERIEKNGLSVHISYPPSSEAIIDEEDFDLNLRFDYSVSFEKKSLDSFYLDAVLLNYISNKEVFLRKLYSILIYWNDEIKYEILKSSVIQHLRELLWAEKRMNKHLELILPILVIITNFLSNYLNMPGEIITNLLLINSWCKSEINNPDLQNLRHLISKIIENTYNI